MALQISIILVLKECSHLVPTDTEHLEQTVTELTVKLRFNVLPDESPHLEFIGLQSSDLTRAQATRLGIVGMQENQRQIVASGIERVALWVVPFSVALRARFRARGQPSSASVLRMPLSTLEQDKGSSAKSVSCQQINSQQRGACLFLSSCLTKRCN